MNRQAVFIRVRRQVQGVGFRPFVWQLAHEMGLCGRVWNDPEGVAVEASGDRMDAFFLALRQRAPSLSRVDAVEVVPLLGDRPEGFEIVASRGRGAQTRATPDAATCVDCAAETHAPGRRQGYSFTNCTQCGPRFTILRGLPYDRAQTTMATFTMCPACRAEYENPDDDRFHVQPIACPSCGPRLWYETGSAAVPGEPVALAVGCLRAGGSSRSRVWAAFTLPATRPTLRLWPCRVPANAALQNPLP